MSVIPLPPDEPSYGRSCDAGRCNAPAVGWRWFTDVREWLPACANDIGGKGVPGRFRVYDTDYPDAHGGAGETEAG